MKVCIAFTILMALLTAMSSPSMAEGEDVCLSPKVLLVVEYSTRQANPPNIDADFIFDTLIDRGFSVSILEEEAIGLDFERDLEPFDVIIYSGGTWQGPIPGSTPEALYDARKAGKGFIFVGDDGTTPKLTSVTRLDWTPRTSELFNPNIKITDEVSHPVIAGLEGLIFKATGPGGDVNPDRLNDPSVQRFAKTVETTPDYPDGIDVLMVHEDPGEFPGSRHVNIVWEIAWTDEQEAMRTLLTNAVIWASPDHIGSLIDMVAGMDIHAGIKNSLLAKLSAACNALGRGQIHTASNGLNAFINEVEAQKGKKLTDEQAEIVMGAALTAIGSLSDGASPAPSKHGGIEPRGKLSAIWGGIKEN